MNRVLIIGSQGSGKTTLAELVAAALLNHTHYAPTSVKVSDPGSTEERALTLHDIGQITGRIELTEVHTINGDQPETIDNPDAAFGTLDASKWADGFMICCLGNPSIPYDKGSMIGYFANAIESGRSAGRSEVIAEQTDEKRDRINEAGSATEALLAYAKAIEKLVVFDGLEGHTFYSLRDINTQDLQEERLSDGEAEALEDVIEARRKVHDMGLVTVDDGRIIETEQDPADRKTIEVGGVAEAYEQAKGKL